MEEHRRRRLRRGLFVWGIAALVTWIFRTAVTPDIVKNLATTFLGLAVPIVATFMRGR